MTLAGGKALTQHWADTFDGSASTVFSGAGAWLALCCALAGAHGEARLELERATGVDGGDAAAIAKSGLDVIAGIDGLTAAVAL